MDLDAMPLIEDVARAVTGRACVYCGGRFRSFDLRNVRYVLFGSAHWRCWFKHVYPTYALKEYADVLALNLPRRGLSRKWRKHAWFLQRRYVVASEREAIKGLTP